MAGGKASDHIAVFDHFRIPEQDRPRESCYAYAPVFRTRVDGVAAAVKRTRKATTSAAIMRWLQDLARTGIPAVSPIHVAQGNPALVEDRMWVAYRWVDGRAYDGSLADVAAAGDLLGRLHARIDYHDPAMPRFPWPQHDRTSVEEDVEDLTAALMSRAPDIAERILARNVTWHRVFMDTTLPLLRDADLPWIVASTDFKANNLVYAASGPVLIDPDNADCLPRILDLAMAALLFHNESATAPARMFSEAEWAVFAESYRAHVSLTDTEIALWSTAVQYLITEWGTWTLADADDGGTWSDPHQRGFLRDLALAHPDRFAADALLR